MARIKIKPTLNANEATEKPDHSYNADENAKFYLCSEKQFGSFKNQQQYQ